MANAGITRCVGTAGVTRCASNKGLRRCGSGDPSHLYRQGRQCGPGTPINVWIDAMSLPTQALAIPGVEGCVYFDPADSLSSTPGTVYELVDVVGFDTCAECTPNSDACAGCANYTQRIFPGTAVGEIITVGALKAPLEWFYACDRVVRNGTGKWVLNNSQQEWTTLSTLWAVPPLNDLARPQWTITGTDSGWQILTLWCDPLASFPAVPEPPDTVFVDGYIETVTTSSETTFDPTLPTFDGTMVAYSITGSGTFKNYKPALSDGTYRANVKTASGNWIQVALRLQISFGSNPGVTFNTDDVVYDTHSWRANWAGTVPLDGSTNAGSYPMYVEVGP